MFFTCGEKELLGFTFLTTFIYNIQQFNHINHVVYYIPSIYLLYNWKFVHLTAFIQFPLSLPFPLIATNLFSFSLSVFGCLFFEV